MNHAENPIQRRRRSMGVNFILPALVILITCLLATGCQSQKEPSTESQTESHRTLDAPPEAVQFVPNNVCSECHPTEFKEWTGSHHERAMQVANDQTVLGDFNNRTFTHFGVTSRFFKKDGTFFVRTDGPDGKMGDFEIQYTFGVEPLQQYLIELDKGRIQALIIAWDTNNKHWFHLYPDEKIPHDDPLHWTGRLQNWNSRCAECHMTDFKKGYDPDTNTYNTTWTEINVSCQSCHGPGETHVAWTRASKGNKGSRDEYGLVVDFKKSDSLYQIDACGQCHARRHQVSSGFRHGQNLMDDFVPARFQEGLYHVDGQIQDEVYVWGSFIQSKMYQKGVRCTDCHNPHTAQLIATGNALCTRCHQLEPDPRFETLKSKVYDTAKHHFHKANSPGAECANCHMPSKNYMVVDPRHDHSFRIPRPDLSILLSTPNACTRCHEDKTNSWAQEAIEQWYGKQERPPHFAVILAAGRAGDPGAEMDLVKLAQDKSQSAIVRATALELLERYGMEGIAAMIKSIKDESPLVRYSAVRSLYRLEPSQKLEWIASALTDPVRAVRIEAARVIAPVPKEMFTDRQQTAFEAALAEFIETQTDQADFPSSHLNLGIVYANRGDRDKAEASYKRAIDLAPDFLPVRFNLANLYNAQNRNDDAEEQLLNILKVAPDSGEAHYSLGLLLAETKQLDESAAHLKRAADRLPGNARVRYNLGLIHQNLNRPQKAESSFFAALELSPNDPEVIQALTILYMQQEQWEKALPYAETLMQLFPDDPSVKEVMDQIEEQIASESTSK